MTRNPKTSHKRRDHHRDNDDMRGPLGPDERSGVHNDTKSEARGDAREAIGNTARDTDTNPTGPEGNDKTKNRPRRDQFDDDLAAS